ncbi:MAG: gabD [Rickettsiales bacterium]|jgi:succinate-semialdehyde dehydrogenase/glutarate-semialdehyde dehydrogenase|nr:gabD [Rickettsiales bacterium]
MKLFTQKHDFSALAPSLCYIGGKWIGASDRATLTVHNPATGEGIGNVPSVTREDTVRAIDAAEKALPTWAALTGKQRSHFLRTWFDLITEHTDALAAIMTLEQGKPLAEAKSEIAYAAAFVEWFSEEAKRTYGTTIPAPKANQRITVIKQPVGVVATITPWNFPSAMITRKVAAALAAGCTVISKPDSKTPYSALALAKLAEEAGIPAGVFNVITGKAETIGGVLTASPKVRKLSFTGSTEVGKILLRQSADTVKKVSMELGGNAPFIVFADANLDKAVEGLVASKFRNSGQTCVCANRIMVESSIASAFEAKLRTAVDKLVVGNGMEVNTNQGPLISEQARQKVEGMIAEAVASGAKLVCGGKSVQGEGYFFSPTILTGVKPDMRIAREEVFGPVAPIMTFTTEAEATGIANATPFGLASYVYTKDLARAIRVSEALEYGIVGVNEGLISTEVAPFGGIKESGLGREGSFLGIEEYLETKYICMGI